jgi:hypothetical protein
LRWPVNACADEALGATERWATACAWRARCMKAVVCVAGVWFGVKWWSEQQAAGVPNSQKIARTD